MNPRTTFYFGIGALSSIFVMSLFLLPALFGFGLEAGTEAVTAPNRIALEKAQAAAGDSMTLEQFRRAEHIPAEAREKWPDGVPNPYSTTPAWMFYFAKGVTNAFQDGLMAIYAHGVRRGAALDLPLWACKAVQFSGMAPMLVAMWRYFGVRAARWAFTSEPNPRGVLR